MAEQQNKVELEINNNEPITDNNTNVASPTVGVIKENANINNNEPVNDNNNNESAIDNNTNVSSPIAGPSGTAIKNNDNEPINDTNNSDSSPVAGPSGTRVIQRKSWIKCDICNVFVSGQKAMQVHLSGKRHNIIAKKINECPRNYNCEICKIKANSERQLADHYASKKHKARIEELERFEDIKFYCTYGTVVIILAWILISYLLYVTFVFTE